MGLGCIAHRDSSHVRRHLVEVDAFDLVVLVVDEGPGVQLEHVGVDRDPLSLTLSFATSLLLVAFERGGVCPILGGCSILDVL